MSEDRTARPDFEARLRQLWPHFIHSFALSDHVGDASEALRTFAGLAGLPMPDDYAEFGQWLDWADEQGASDGIAAVSNREKANRDV